MKKYLLAHFAWLQSWLLRVRERLNPSSTSMLCSAVLLCQPELMLEVSGVKLISKQCVEFIINTHSKYIKKTLQVDKPGNRSIFKLSLCSGEWGAVGMLNGAVSVVMSVIPMCSLKFYLSKIWNKSYLCLFVRISPTIIIPVAEWIKLSVYLVRIFISSGFESLLRWQHSYRVRKFFCRTPSVQLFILV